MRPGGRLLIVLVFAMVIATVVFVVLVIWTQPADAPLSFTNQIKTSVGQIR